MNFRGEKRSNATHESKTDPEAKLARKGKGKEARLSYSFNGLMENRNGLLVDLTILPADGYAERDAATMMLEGSIQVVTGLRWRRTRPSTRTISSRIAGN